MVEAVVIDGARGEGGGQMLRTSVALSLIHGRPVVIERVRAGRGRPGLLRQHLAAVRAAAEISNAEVEGAELHSSRVALSPGVVRHGDYSFSVGSAGSATLVLHTVLWPLLCAAGRSRIVFEGGTHNPAAPPFEHVGRSLIPILRRLGARIETRFERAGFFPSGGGRFVVELEGETSWRPLRLHERGGAGRVHGRIIASSLAPSVARREVEVLRDKLSLTDDEIEVVEPPSPGPGNAVQIQLDFPNVTNVITSFGTRGLPAELVAGAACDDASAHWAAGVPVDEFLADQLLVPLDIAGSGSFRTGVPTPHTRTNLEVIAAFSARPPEIHAVPGEEGVFTIGYEPDEPGGTVGAP